MPLTPKRVGNVAYSLVMFVGVSVLAGVLVAGLFVPAAGLAGLGARSGATELENLPAELSTPPQSERSKVLMANGELLANFYDENRVYVPLKNIAPVMRKAQVAIEDHRYYEHGAIDVYSTFRAFVRNSAGGQTAGGSSITQQYVKMVQVEAAAAKGDDEAVLAAQASTYSRKIQELRYAIALERKFTKDQILERYLNIAYYGDGAYGVEAAAHHYFNTTAKKLTLAQAAMLAGLVQNPTQVNPVDNTTAAMDRRDVVINRMATLGIVSKAEATKAKKTKWNGDAVTEVPNGCVGTQYPFLCDYVKRSLLTNAAFGKTVDDRKNLINRGGLTIQTAIDPKTQDTAEEAIGDFVDPKDPVISTMTMIQPGTGLILAMAQSRPVMGKDKGETYYNYAVDPAMGDYNGFQAGSTFKAFTGAAALSKGIPISKRYNARSPMEFKGKQYESCDGPFPSPPYKASNSVGFGGGPNIDMQKGFNSSVNTYFLQLEQDAGLCDTTRMAEKLGIKLTDGRDFDYYSRIVSFTLGSAEISPLSLNEAYATFAARGIHCDPHIVDSVKTKAGKSLRIPDGNCKRVLDEDVADAMNKMLAGVVKDGTGRRATLDGGYPQAGKTGTTNDNKAVWFAGYTPEIAGVAMIAVDPSQSPFKKGGKNYRNGFKNYRLPVSDTYLEGSGSGDAGRYIYKPAMEEALDGKPKTAFHEPPADLVKGKTIDLPDTSGRSPAEIKTMLEKIGFNVVESYRYDSSTPAGRYMYMTPGGRAAQFSTITMVYSRGKDPAIEARARAEAAEREKAEREKAEREKAEREKEERERNKPPAGNDPTNGPPDKPR